MRAKKSNWKDIIIRTLKTFLQGFLGALYVELQQNGGFEDWEVMKSLLVGAVAGGLCAVMNLVIGMLKSDTEKIEYDEEED